MCLIACVNNDLVGGSHQGFMAISISLVYVASVLQLGPYIYQRHNYMEAMLVLCEIMLMSFGNTAVMSYLMFIFMMYH